MKPIQEQEWRQESSDMASAQALVVRDANGAVVARCGTTDDGKAIAALPKVLRALLEQGDRAGGEAWHTRGCWIRGRASCSEDCRHAREALSACGVDVG